MDANTEIDLTKLHAAIAADIAAQFPAFQTVQFYREEDERTPLTADQMPACLMQLSDMEPAGRADQPGTTQFAVDARFEARVIIGFRTPHAKVEIRKLAGALAVFISNRKWVDPDDATKKLPTLSAEVTAVASDDFHEQLDRFEVWRVEWVHRIHLGATIYDGVGVIPGEVYYSWLPEIGAAHEDDYQTALPEL